MFADSPYADAPKKTKKPVQFTTRFLFLVTFSVALTFGVYHWLGPFVTVPVVLLMTFVVLKRIMTNLEAVVTAVILTVLVALLIPAVQVGHTPSNRTICSNNMKQIALALHNYHDDYGSFPPAYIADKNGKPMHSWRVLILPYLDGGNLYDQYDFNESWNGPNNSKLAAAIPYPYQCPSDPSKGTSLNTNYVAIVGPSTVWPKDKCRKLSEIKDGSEYTIMLVEIANSNVHWMEPRDLPIELITTNINPKSKKGISSQHNGGVFVGMADGSVLFLSESVTAATVKAMATVSGGETIRWRENPQPELIQAE